MYTGSGKKTRENHLQEAVIRSRTNRIHLLTFDEDGLILQITNISEYSIYLTMAAWIAEENLLDYDDDFTFEAPLVADVVLAGEDALTGN